MEIGHIIAQLRNEKKLSQRQLASAINVSPGVVGLWETNKRVPSFECVIAIADFFEISTDTLFDADRKLSPSKYQTNLKISQNEKVMLETFSQLNEDNQYILIGEGKKLLKSQKHEEKRKSSTTAKAI